jgi:hypothetical protein
VNLIRPTGFYGWASGASGLVTQPLASEQAIGFQPTGIARAEYWNWIANGAYQWQKFTDDVATGLIGGALGVKSVTCDGVGGASGVSGYDGAVKVSASYGATGPTGPAVPRGVLGLESALFAAASCDGQTLMASYNISSASHVATGIWALQLAVKPLSDRRVVLAGAQAGGYVEAAMNFATASGLGQVLVSPVTGGVVQNVPWTLAVYHI